MFRLLKLIFFLGCLGGFAWFALTVELGERTLFEHVQAIWKEPASRDLVRGAKDKVGSLVDRATDKVVKGVSKSSPGVANAHGERMTQAPEAIPEVVPPLEDLPTRDRKALRGLIGHSASR